MINPLKMGRRIKALEASLRQQQAEIARLRNIEALAGRVVKLLNDGQVNYDLVKRLEQLINARDGA